MQHRVSVRRRKLLKVGCGLAGAPLLLALGTSFAQAQAVMPAADEPASPDPSDAPVRPPVEPLPTRFAQGPIPNNIVGLNVARLHQPIYIWATSDAVNANGGDWGYITVLWTVEDREARNAEYNLQQFLDRCFEHHVQPIVRVATTFTRSSRPGNSPPGSKGADGSWARPDWDEPKRWREFFERAQWPSQHAWIIVGNEPNLGREWGGAVDAAGYARYLAHFLDTFNSSPRFDVVGGALDISNPTALPEMQDALEFLDIMGETVPGIFERLPAWAANPYRVISGGPGVRYTHLAYEAELDRIGREMPVLITEAGHLETGDEHEIARFYAEAFRDWMADPKVVAATPLFWHPDRNEFWMFELDSKNRFVYKSPTYELLRKLPRVAGSPEYAVTMGNVARVTPFEQPAVAETEAGEEDEPSDGAPAGAAQASATSAHASSAPERSVLQVANTGGAGARLRTAPSTAAEAIAVLPDGAVVEALGAAVNSPEQSWRPVRAEDGAEGWIASELLAPAEVGE